MPRYRTRSWRAFDPAAASTRTAQVVTLATAPASVRILGLDPGSQRTGYGIIECSGARSTSIAHGCIAAQGSSLSERLRYIFQSVQELIERHRPDEVAIERVFVNRNVDSALKLGHARGAALCAVPPNTPVFEYTPRAIKLAVVGFGGAEKAQVAHMIRVLLTVDGRLSSDASDALAVAVCHAHSRRMHGLTGTAGGAVAAHTASAGRTR
jgi:crossover junction endodeoxyribonuclease RuvC